MIGCTTNHSLTDTSKTRPVAEARESTSPWVSRPKASSLVGSVVAVIDGDTIEIRDQQENSLRVQLYAIDAPEPDQPLGYVSRDNLANLIGNKTVLVDGQKRDDYGRLIAKVFSDDRDVGLEQLKAGLAWHYLDFAKDQDKTDRRSYAQAEQSARSQKLGLWRDPANIPPWLFRHHNRFKPGSQTPKNHSPATTIGIESEIRGNRRSKIYHWPGCPNYDDISPHNRVIFPTASEAERAGYRAARNCS